MTKKNLSTNVSLSPGIRTKRAFLEALLVHLGLVFALILFVSQGYKHLENKVTSIVNIQINDHGIISKAEKFSKGTLKKLEDSGLAVLATLRPTWAKRESIIAEPNTSYFSDRSIQNLSWTDRILNPKRQKELQRQYEDMNRDYDMRMKYGLMDDIHRIGYFNQTAGFSNNVMGQIRGYQVENGRETMISTANRMASQNDEIKDIVKAGKSVEKPAGIIGGAYMVGTGTPLGVKLSNDSSLTSRTDIPNQQASLTLNSPFLNTSFAMNQLVSANWVPGMGTPVDPSQHDERYRFTVSRPLPLWNLVPGLSYGSTSTMVIASLSKPITDHLVCVVSNNTPLDPVNSDYHYNTEQVIRLSYGISF
jgi:hypothetical protein